MNFWEYKNSMKNKACLNANNGPFNKDKSNKNSDDSKSKIINSNMLKNAKTQNKENDKDIYLKNLIKFY